MKLNRKWFLVIALVLSMTMAIGGTLAYLTDRDSAANVLTFGNVDIELNEDFSQGSELIPGVDIEKKPTITNTGRNDAWVWATIAIPSALDNDDASQNVVHFNFSKESIADGYWQWTDNNGYMVQKNVKLEDGDEYNVYTVLYETKLQPGETTAYPVMTKVYMDAHIDIDPNGNLYHVENGDVTELDWNINTDGTPIMHVSAYAIQTDGFETVQDAYAAYTAQWGENGGAYTTITNASPESGAVRPAGMEVPDDGVISGVTILDNSDEATNLRALYENGLTTSVSISDSTFDGTYAMNLTTQSGTTGLTLSADNTNFMGWVSYSGFDSATFANCTFRTNSEGTYNYLRAYDPTTFMNCEFKGTTLDVADNDNGSITLINCTYNSVLIENASQLKLDGDTTVTISNN